MDAVFYLHEGVRLSKDRGTVMTYPSNVTSAVQLLRSHDQTLSFACHAEEKQLMLY